MGELCVGGVGMWLSRDSDGGDFLFVGSVGSRVGRNFPSWDQGGQEVAFYGWPLHRASGQPAAH